MPRPFDCMRSPLLRLLTIAATGAAQDLAEPLRLRRHAARIKPVAVKALDRERGRCLDAAFAEVLAAGAEDKPEVGAEAAAGEVVVMTVAADADFIGSQRRPAVAFRAGV